MGHINNVVEYKRKDDREYRFFCADESYAEARKMFEKAKSIIGVVKLRIRTVITQQEIVERWTKDHPRKTRQSELLKLFPRVSMTADDVIAFCPESMDSAFVCPIKERDHYDPECGECRKKYWLEEVEDDDRSNDKNRRKWRTQA